VTTAGEAGRTGPRYAVYLAPAPGSALWRFGSSVVGYDAASGTDMPPHPALPGERDLWRDLTAEPRRYGFHGTLKAPFGLAEGLSEGDLLTEGEAFAAGRTRFALPRLEVALLGSFVALVPDPGSGALDALAGECVRAFDRLRAPLPAADRQSRLQAPLTDRQIRHLDAWGYPHVFEDFRFHMTLTGPLPPDRRESVRAALAGAYAELAPGLAVDGISLFRQDDPAGRFRVLARFPFCA
jgi:putative phosphonate metabolism protein